MPRPNSPTWPGSGCDPTDRSCSSRRASIATGRPSPSCAPRAGCTSASAPGGRSARPPSAPHGVPLAYPGTCRDLTTRQRGERRGRGRPPALRLRIDEVIEFDDLVAGRVGGATGDVVLQRNDGVPAYHLAVVVDDADQGVTLVVRGDDLTASTPAQILLQRLLGLAAPAYAHVPLVVGPDGARLAKRHAGATLADLARRGIEPPEVLRRLATSLGIGVDVPLELAALAAAFRWEGIPRTAWTAPSDLPRSKP
ncbi:MAG: glutamate--tRNA ligase family protein [Ilumatobacteraceae bacterium]